jgi:hypothetical protein
MKNTAEIGTGAIIYIPSFIISGVHGKETKRQHGGRINLTKQATNAKPSLGFN